MLFDRFSLPVAAIALMLPLLASAQDLPDSSSSPESISSFGLTGTSLIEGQYADQQGVGQDVPSRYARWTLTPTVILFDIPFTGSMLLSTEQSRGRQSINSFNLSFSLDQEQLQARLRERLIGKISSAAFGSTIDDVEGLGDVESALSDPARLADIDRLSEKVEEGTASSEEIEELRAKQAEIEKLRETYEKLSAIRDKVGEVEELRTVAETGTATDDMYDTDHLKGALSELDMLSGMEKFLYNFPRFGIGVNYPYYTPFTISGVAVNGVDIVFNPGKFYVAGTVGTARRDVPEALAADSTYISFDRTLYAGRLGYGREGETHVLLTAMHVGDENTSVIVDTTTGFYLAPQENWVLGLDLEFPIVKDVFTIRSEVAGSLLTGDLSAPEVETSESIDAPQWLNDLVGFKTSSFFDYAVSVQPELTLTKAGTRVRGRLQRIGPGYVSLGIPYLRNDLFRYEGDIEQKLVKRQVTLSAKFRRDVDNLIDWKRSTTTTMMYGLGLGLNFRKLPFLRVNYSPHRQTNDQTGEFEVNNTITLFNATLGHRYRFGESVGGVTTGTFVLNDVETAGHRFDSETKMYILSQFLTFGSAVSLQATGSLSTPTSVIDTLRNVTTIDVGATVTFLKDWSGTLGGVLIDEEETSTKTGFYVGLFVPIEQIGSRFDIRAEKNVYDAQRAAITGIDDFDEFVLRASIMTQW